MLDVSHTITLGTLMPPAAIRGAAACTLHHDRTHGRCVAGVTFGCEPGRSDAALRQPPRVWVAGGCRGYFNATGSREPPFRCPFRKTTGGGRVYCGLNDEATLALATSPPHATGGLCRTLRPKAVYDGSPNSSVPENLTSIPHEKEALAAQRASLAAMLLQLLDEKAKREEELKKRLLEMEDKREEDIKQYW